MKAILVILLMVALTSCGGDYYSSASGTVTKTQAAKIFSSDTSSTSPFSQVPTSNSGATNAAKNANGLSHSRHASNSRDQQDPLTACTKKNPATTVDTDQDEIPATVTYEYNCSGVSGWDNAKIDYNGSVIINDKDDNNKSGGYKYEYDLTYKVIMDTSREGGTYNGKFESTIKDNTNSYTNNYQGVQYTSNSSNKDFDITYGGSGTFTITYDTPATPSTSNGTTTLDYFAGYKSTDPDDTYEVVFKGEGTAKFKGESCQKYFESGYFTWTDGKKNVIKVEFVSCTESKWTYNGETLK